MRDLNPPQLQAVRYLDGPLLVIAGAGSGKTRVITRKIAHLIEHCGMAPRQITAITFTNKAAREMQERAVKQVGEGAREVSISTFHALGARLLRQEARSCKLKPGFSILDAGDSRKLLQELLGNVDKARVGMVGQLISGWKSRLLDPQQAAEEAEDERMAAAAQLYVEYQRALNAYQAVDFDDLIRLPVRLLEDDEEVAQRWRNRIWHLLVDEYQDCNRGQNRMMQLLTGERAAFTAVGDDDQSIYAWRGADSGNLMRLQQEYPRLKVIKLEQNYRSTTRILKAANAVIGHNPKLFDKNLWSEKGHGEAIRVMACRDDAHEAEWVVTRLMAHRFESRGNWRDYAILYRGNHQARQFEQLLRAHKVAYLLSGGQSFFEKSEIKDLISYLRLLSNQDDDPAFIRAATVPKRGIGSTTLEALGQAAGRRHISLFAAIAAAGIENEIKPPQLAALHSFRDFIRRTAGRAASENAGSVLESLLAAIAYEAWLFESQSERDAQARWANVREFVSWLTDKAAEEGKNLLELTQTVALITMLDKQDDDRDAVQLATLHAAKGLEFRHVFLVGVEEGSLPHRESIDKGDIEEERRLMYVGITRACMSLNISWCARRKQGREIVERQASRFIEEMDDGGDGIRRLGSNAGGESGTQDRSAVNARLASLKAMLKSNPI